MFVGLSITQVMLCGYEKKNGVILLLSAPHSPELAAKERSNHATLAVSAFSLLENTIWVVQGCMY